MSEIKNTKTIDAMSISKDPKSLDHTINNSHEGLQELIEKNIKWSQLIYDQNKKIKKRLTLMAMGNYLRLVLFLIPLILGIIYLPAFLGDTWKEYSSLLGVRPENLLNGSVLDQNQIKAFIEQLSEGQDLQQLLNNKK